LACDGEVHVACRILWQCQKYFHIFPQTPAGIKSKPWPCGTYSAPHWLAFIFCDPCSDSVSCSTSLLCADIFAKYSKSLPALVSHSFFVAERIFIPYPNVCRTHRPFWGYKSGWWLSVFRSIVSCDSYTRRQDTRTPGQQDTRQLLARSLALDCVTQANPRGEWNVMWI